MSTDHFSEMEIRPAIWFHAAKDFIVAAATTGRTYKHDVEDNLAIQGVMLGDAILAAFDARFDPQGGRGAASLTLKMTPDPTPPRGPSSTQARINKVLETPMSNEDRLDKAVAFLERIRLDDQAGDQELLPLPQIRRFGR